MVSRGNGYQLEEGLGITCKTSWDDWRRNKWDWRRVWPPKEWEEILVKQEEKDCSQERDLHCDYKGRLWVGATTRRGILRWRSIISNYFKRGIISLSTIHLRLWYTHNPRTYPEIELRPTSFLHFFQQIRIIAIARIVVHPIVRFILVHLQGQLC